MYLKIEIVHCICSIQAVEKMLSVLPDLPIRKKATGNFDD